MGWGDVAPQSAAQAKHSNPQQARCQSSHGDPLAVSCLGGERHSPHRAIRRERVEDRVELLAATAILSLSVGCGLAAARGALEALFSLMRVHSAVHDVSLAPLAMEFPYEDQPRLDTPAA